jgi:hypothetical protein
MNSLFKLVRKKPICILLAVNIIAGLFIFRDYGLAWDEPLFYDYGDELGYAYSPREWLSGRMILVKTSKSVAPSTLALSMMSRGSPTM